MPCIAGLSARAEQLLIGASVYREPADANAVVFHLGEHDWTAARAPDRRGPAPPYQPPRDLHELLAACTASGLLHAVARGPAGPADCWQVDPWVAAELHQQLGAAGRVAVLVAAHRRAAEYWQWRAAAWPQDRRSDLHDLLEARHHLFLAGDAEQASEVTHAVCAQLHAWGDLGREAELIQATLEMLPTRSVSRANWMHELGTIYQIRAEFGEAYRCYAGAVQMFALLGDFDGVSRGQHSLGVLAQAQGDYRRAERHYKRSSAAERRAGQRPAGGLTEPVELTEGPVFKQAVPDLKPVTPLPPAGPGQPPGAPSAAAHPGLPPATARPTSADVPAPSDPAATQPPPAGPPPAASQASGNGEVRAAMPPATARPTADGALAAPQAPAPTPVPQAPATRATPATPPGPNGGPAAAAPVAPVRCSPANPGGTRATATLRARAPATAATARAASNGVAAAATATVPQTLPTPAALPARAPLRPAPASPAAPVPAATAAAPAPARALTASPAKTSAVNPADAPADTARAARPEPAPAAQTATDTRPPTWPQPPRRVARRRSLVLPAVIAVGLAALSAVGISAALARTADHHAGSGQAGGGQVAPAVRSVGAIRAEAAAWVAAQVSSSAVVACDPAECAVLHQRGLPAGDLLTLGPGGPADPLASDVIVVTAAVRAEFGARLAGVYAPDVLASFGTGATGIQVRLVAADGTAAYQRAARADLAVRRRFGTEMLHNANLIVSGQVRRALAAGLVDSRLLATLATLADIQSLRVLSFGDAGPHASRGVPLRSAEIAAPPGAAASWLRTALRFLATQQDPFQPSLTAMAHPAGAGRAVLIEYPSPSPLGLLEASGATPGA